MTKKEVEVWCAENGYLLIDLESVEDKYISFGDLQHIAEDICILKKGEVNKRSRDERIVFARWLLWSYLKNTTQFSLARIGATYGMLDHATVLYGIKKLKTKRFYGWRKHFKDNFERKINSIHDKLDLERVYNEES